MRPSLSRTAYAQSPAGTGWNGQGGAPGASRSGWSPNSVYQDAGGSGYAPSEHEDLLTVGILRQLLAGAEDPYQALYAPAGAGAPVYAGTQQSPAGPGATRYPSTGASEAMDDIAQLERLVGRLANSQQAYLHSGQAANRSSAGSLYGAAEAAPMGAEVVARMVENISRDSRLLPPIQQAVQDLEPAVRKLIRHDARFFTDANHPARRLLDDITQRSLVFSHVEAPGFSRFMRLIDQAVAHLSKAEITSAAPFETVRRALHAAWDAQQKKLEAKQEQEKRALLLAEEREMRAERVAEEIGALAELAGAPQDIVDFAYGPWVEVVASPPADASGRLSPEASSALALLPLLLWSVQPELARDDPERLDEAAVMLPVRLRTELENIGQPQDEIDAFLSRLAELHRDALAAREPDIELPEGSEQDEAPAQINGYDPQPDDLGDGSGASLYGPDFTEVEPPTKQAPQSPPESDGFEMGAWVELNTSGRLMRTQLTWSSPHNTLFLFTAPDGSTQSMTRRMRDKLIASGALRLIDTQPATERALRDAAQPESGAPPMV